MLHVCSLMQIISSKFAMNSVSLLSGLRNLFLLKANLCLSSRPLVSNRVGGASDATTTIAAAAAAAALQTTN